QVKTIGGPVLRFDAAPDAKLAFWQRLAVRFPEQGAFWLGWADELYWMHRLAGFEDPAAYAPAYERYERAVTLDPSFTMLLSYPDDKELAKVGGQLFLQFRLAKMRALKDRYCLDMMAWLAEDLRAEYAQDPQGMSEVDAILGPYAGFAQRDPRGLEEYTRGRAYAEQGRHREAIEAFSEALRIDDHYARAYAGRGHSRGCLRDPDGAADYDKSTTL